MSKIAIVSPNLWRLEAGPFQCELDKLAKPQGTEQSPTPRPLWLSIRSRFDSESATAQDSADESQAASQDSDRLLEQSKLPENASIDYELILPSEVAFVNELAPCSLTPATARAFLPAAPKQSVEVEFYRRCKEPPQATLSPLPRANSHILLPTTTQIGHLVLCHALECTVEYQGFESTITVVQEPSGVGLVSGLCPVCHSAATAWNTCAQHGLHCNRHRQTCRNCKKNYCALCSSAVCVVCQRGLCSDCSSLVCDICHGHTCEEHHSVCSECHASICSNCSGGTCAIGLTPLCAKCASHCQACGQIVRERLLALCHTCGQIVCPNCKSVCHIDGRVMCPTHAGLCHTCETPICASHREYCAVCGQAFCKSHYSECKLCGRKTCLSCHERNICTQCQALTVLPSADSDIIRERLTELLKDQPCRSFSGLRGSLQFKHRLFELHCGLTEYRVSTSQDMSRCVSIYKRTLLQRLLGRGFHL